MTRAYTRKDYIRKIPGSRIVQYDMGNLSGDFPLKVTLVVKSSAQLSHNALEAARIASNRYMHRKSGRMGYHLKILGFPQLLDRDKPIATDDNAVMLQDSMSKAFGKPVSSVAIVKPNQKVLTVYTNKRNFKDAKEALRRAAMKFPVTCRIEIEEGSELVK